MRKDIEQPKVKDIYVAVVQVAEEDWKVYLLNRSETVIDTILVSSKGYGHKNGEEQKTSVLRHMIPRLEPGEYALIEPIDKQVFHLNNEYWVSFYSDGKLYDKKYIFVPDTLLDEHFSNITELDLPGVLHS